MAYYDPRWPPGRHTGIALQCSFNRSLINNVVKNVCGWQKYASISIVQRETTTRNSHFHTESTNVPFLVRLNKFIKTKLIYFR